MDRFGEYFDQCSTKTREFSSGESAGVARGSDTRVKESFIGVDIAHSVKERLVEERGFDRRFSIVEERDEVFEFNGKWFGTGPFVSCIGCHNGETAKAAGIDEAEFFAATEGQDGVGVRRNRGVRSGDEEASGHA